MPDWIDAFQSMCAIVSGEQTDEAPTRIDPSETPFGELVDLIARWGRGTVLSSEWLTESARTDLYESLCDRIEEVVAQPLHVDYHRFVDDVESLTASSSDHYDSYIAAFRSGRYERFFTEFAVAARLLVTVVRQWREATRELCVRLDADHGSIASMLGVDRLGPVTGVDPGSGDAHNRGRTVTILDFEAGRVVYKPRSVAPERGFFRFLSTVTDALTELPAFPTPDVIERDGYGWMEHVASGSFSDLAAVGTYYERAGALTWLLTLLGTTDLHAENLIAADESPVVVDAETVIPPTTEPSGTFTDDRIRVAAIQSSPLRSSLVPFRTDETTRDRSGFGMVSAAESHRPTIRWEEVGTDAIDIRYERGEIVPQENYPKYDGDPVPPRLFADRMVAGFERAQAATLSTTANLVDKVTTAFENTPIRVLLRESLFYQFLLDTVSNPEFLRDGAAHERRVVDALLDYWSATGLPTTVRERIVTAERDAILRRDIPRFVVPADGTDLWMGDRIVVPDRYATSGVAEAKRRIERLDESHAARQRGLFRATVTDTSLLRGDG
ncbi:MAG: type 2 lanthipeptide synthetase LanM [Halobaculum sp.]